MLPKNILQFFLFFFISIVCSLPIFPLLMAEKNNQNLIIMMFFISTLAVFIGLVYFVNYKKRNVISFNLRPFSVKLCFFYILIVWIMETIIIRPVHFYFFSKSHQPYDFYYLIGVLVVAPILEEIVFRNILLNSLLNSYSKNKSIIISSVAFGLVHGNPIQIIFATIIGFFLGIVYVQKKNIGYTIVLHFSANLFVMMSQVYSQNNSKFSFFYITCVNILVSFSLLLFMYKKYDYSLIKIIKQK